MKVPRVASAARSTLASARAWNIALRTAHIAATGVLLGGHAFDVSRDRLLPALGWTIATGIVLAALETGMSLVWFHQLRGLMTMAKTGLLFLVPYFWADRLWILMAVVVLASVGSHMPARFRYYSVLRREVIRDSCGPGTARFAEESQGDGK